MRAAAASARRRAARPAARGPPPACSPSSGGAGLRGAPPTSSTSSVWPWTSRWWKTFCSTPRSAASSGSTTAVRRRAPRPAASPSAGALGADDPLELGEHALGRDPREPGRAAGAPPRAVSGSSSSSSSTARRAARSVRSGSSASAAAQTIRSRRASRSARPPCGSSSSPPASGSAIALIVKSRAARSAARSPSRSAHEVDVPGAGRGPTTRQAPNAPESSNAVPRAARAIARGRRLGVAGHARRRGRSSSRPSSAVAHGAADEPRRLAGQRLARGLERVASWRVDPRHARRDPAGHLVVDRAEPPRDLLGEDPLAALARRSARPRRPPRPRRRRRGRP